MVQSELNTGNSSDLVKRIKKDSSFLQKIGLRCANLFIFHQTNFANLQGSIFIRCCLKTVLDEALSICRKRVGVYKCG